jgi:hypothetical protein
MRCQTEVPRWQRAITVVAVPVACITTLLVAVANLSSAATAGASPSSLVGVASVPGARPHVPAAGAGSGTTRDQTGLSVPLADARPVPSRWPQPEPMVATNAEGPGSPITPMESTNWSGYVDTGTQAKFTQVTGSWTVPTVTPGPTGYSSTWVGIDGTDTSDLIQAGTEQDWSPQGEVYYSWYEVLPATSMYLGAVYPGDQISVDIVSAGTASWTITVDDVTQRTVWSGAVSYSAPGTSAEWVEEAPTNATSSKLFPLANFGSVQFSNLGIGGPGTAAATVSPVFMVTKMGGAIQAYPGNYDVSTDSFGITHGAPAAEPTTFPAVPVATGNPTTAPPVPTTTPGAPTTTPTANRPSGPGYWLVGRDGGVFAFGSALFHGSPTILGPSKTLTTIRGIVPTADDAGYWLVTLDGGIFAFGDAKYYGSLVSANATVGPIIGITATSDAKGYYMVDANGGVYAFGDARFEGSCGTITGGCDAQVTALVLDGTGNGYWLLLSNCQTVPFGDAAEIPDADCQSVATADNVSARSAVLTPDGQGYWVLLGNAAVYPEGDAKNYGDWTSSVVPVVGDPAVALVPTQDGHGAWLVLADGTVEALGDAPTLGGLSGSKLNAAIFSAAGS